MNELYPADIKMIDLIKGNKFTLSAEIIPPRNGSPQSEILAQIQSLITSGAQFLAVTKGAGGSLRGGSLPIAQAIKDHFKTPAIAHFTCRDLAPAEVENQLMDHHYFGIRNILALRGDPPQGVSDWSPNPNSYPYAYQLIEQISQLNQGRLIERSGFSTEANFKTDFCIGAAAYPDELDHHKRIEHFNLKISSGAEYGITQMLYDVEAYSRFIHGIDQSKKNIPILPGFRILKTRAQALKMKDRFKISIPEKLLSMLPEKEDPQQTLEIFMQLIEDFKIAGAPGIHLFVLSDLNLCAQFLRTLSAK